MIEALLFSLWSMTNQLYSEVVSEEGSYVHQYENVYAAAVGRSFFEQCLLNEFLYLGISTTGMHFLSSV